MWQVFTEMNFLYEVLIHHNVVVPLQHHFIVPEGNTAELMLKYMAQASTPPPFLFKQDHLLKYITVIVNSNVSMTTDVTVKTIS